MTWPTGGQGDGTQPYTGGFGPQGNPNHQQPQQQYGYPPPQQYQYGGLGMYGSAPESEPPRRDRRKLWIALAVVGVLVVGGAVTAVLVFDKAPEPVAVAAPPLKPLDPRTPGWQVQTSKRGVAYDVPKAQWTLRDPDDILPLGPPDGDHVTGTGGATFQVGYCSGQPTSIRAGSAVTAASELPDKSAPVTAQHWAKLAYAYTKGQPADITLEPTKTIKIADGKLTATLAVADVTLHIDDPCFPKTAKVYTVGATSSDKKGAVLIVLFADQGVPNALSESDAMKVMTSMRPNG